MCADKYIVNVFISVTFTLNSCRLHCKCGTPCWGSIILFIVHFGMKKQTYILIDHRIMGYVLKHFICQFSREFHHFYLCLVLIGEIPLGSRRIDVSGEYLTSHKYETLGLINCIAD